MVVKKRTKVLIGVGAGLLVALLLAGALLLRPAASYEFLQGANFVSLSIYQANTSSAGTSSYTPDFAQRQYWTLLPCSEVHERASEELTAQGWDGRFIVSNSTPGFSYSKGPFESILISPATNGGTHVLVLSRANFADRVQSWLCKLTHRK